MFTPPGLLMTRICLLIILLFASAGHAASPAPVAARNGMVVTAQHHATRVGVDVLRNGGNAIDAAIAVGYTLAVVYPAAGNLGGGGFMTVQFADGRRTFIDFRETAPLAATPDMFLDAQGNVIPNATTRGHLAVAVPSTVAGLEYVREKYGTLPRARLIAPAIRLASQGFVLEQGDADMLHEAHRRLSQGRALGRHLSSARPAVRTRRDIRANGPGAHAAENFASEGRPASTAAKPRPR